jgi:membrane fusion protein, multidrug efflux system
MESRRNNFMSNSVKKQGSGLISLSWLLLAFAVVFATFNSCSDDKASGGGFAFPPTPVEVATVKLQKMIDKFEAVGTIEAIDEITVVSEIDAQVVSLPFVEGTYIKKGDLIAQLDDSQLAAEVSRNEALYNQSKASYNRVKSIVEQNVGTPQNLDDALAALKVAEANLEVAKTRLNKTKIVAPFDGVVGARKVSVGTFLRAGQEITQLANLNQIRISFSVPERFLGELKRNAEVTVYSSVYPGYEVNGKIIAIEPILDSETRNVQVVAKVFNPGQKFHPGMSANVAVVLNEKPDALTIPNEAVFANGNQSLVYIIKPDSTVAPVPVTLGLQLPDVVEVVTGLENGMKVVKAGHQKLFPGAKVMPVMNEDKSAQQQQ